QAGPDLSPTRRGGNVSRAVGVPAPVNLARISIAGVPLSPLGLASLRYADCSREEFTFKTGCKRALRSQGRAPAGIGGGRSARPHCCMRCDLRGDRMVTMAWTTPGRNARALARLVARGRAGSRRDPAALSLTRRRYASPRRG